MSLIFDKFKVCPRCDKKYWFKKTTCRKCGLEYIINAIDFKKHFFCIISQYIVKFYSDNTVVLGLADPNQIVVAMYYYKQLISINRTLSIKLTKEQIEKYLLLK